MAMLTLLLRNFFNFFVPNKLRELDQYLLTHHPLVWETRVHWFVFYAVCLIVALIGLGYCYPISFPNKIQEMGRLTDEMAIVRVFALAAFLLLFSLLINGIFTKIAKIGFITTNQKYRTVDFFKLTGIYGLMVVLGVIATSAFHYTIMFRTHCILSEKANYAILQKYVKVYEFYQQDTLKIKGFEEVRDYIAPAMINNSQVYYENSYMKDSIGSDGMDCTLEITAPNIKNWKIKSQSLLPVNKALYDILPTELNYYTANNDYQIAKNTADFHRLLAAGKLQLDARSKEHLINNYLAYITINQPHIDFSQKIKKLIIGKDTCWYSVIDKKITTDYYPAKNKFRKLLIEEGALSFMVIMLLVLLLLGLHAVKSYRYFSLMPIGISFTLFFISMFMNCRYTGYGSTFEQSMLLFYLLCIFTLPFFHRKVSLANPFRVALIYAISNIIFSYTYMNIVYFIPGWHFFYQKSTIIITVLIIYTFLHIGLLLFRNTRFAINAPFVYFMVFSWLFVLTPYLDSDHIPLIKGKIDGLSQFLCTHSLGVFTTFCGLNLLSACFVLPAIVRETSKPQP